MKKNNIFKAIPLRAWCLILVLAALNSLGLILLWRGSGPRGFFSRQAVWTYIGAMAFIAAIALGWKRILQAAPWVAVGWLGLGLVAKSINSDLCFRLGPLVIDTALWSPLSIGLFFAWLTQKLRRCVVGVAIIVTAVLSLSISWACQMLRIESPDELMLQEWTSAPDQAAIVFGNWYNIVCLSLFGTLFLLLVRFCHQARNTPKRVFCVVVGVLLFTVVFCGYAPYYGIVSPSSHNFVPFLSYGGTPLLIAWIAMGILVTSTIDEESRGEG